MFVRLPFSRIRSTKISNTLRYRFNGTIFSPFLSSIGPTFRRKFCPGNDSFRATEIITKTRTIRRSGRAELCSVLRLDSLSKFHFETESHKLTFLKRATTRSIFPESDGKPNQMSEPNSNKSSTSNGSTHSELGKKITSIGLNGRRNLLAEYKYVFLITRRFYFAASLADVPRNATVFCPLLRSFFGKFFQMKSDTDFQSAITDFVRREN